MSLNNHNKKNQTKRQESHRFEKKQFLSSTYHIKVPLSANIHCINTNDRALKRRERNIKLQNAHGQFIKQVANSKLVATAQSFYIDT